jgi:hypothetical protein
MPDYRPTASSTILARARLAQAMIAQEPARSVVITLASGAQVSLGKAMITGSLPGANGAGTIQITYQTGTTASTNPASSTTTSDDWLANNS